jgi:hypothetical protein
MKNPPFRRGEGLACGFWGRKTNGRSDAGQSGAGDGDPIAAPARVRRSKHGTLGRAERWRR